MFDPCVEHCYPRYGKQYSSECDGKCEYARTVKELADVKAEREMIRQAFCKYVPSEYRCDCCKHSYLNNPGTDCCPYYAAGQCDGTSKWEYYGIQED